MLEACPVKSGENRYVVDPISGDLLIKHTQRETDEAIYKQIKMIIERE